MADPQQQPRQYRQRPQHQPAKDPVGRIPPRDTELEEAVLGAMMLEKDAYTRVCDILKPESFYDIQNQRIYEAIQTLGARQMPIDMLTVTEQLRLNGTLEEAGGIMRVSELTSRVSSAANVEFHARIVAQKYLASSNLFHLHLRSKERLSMKATMSTTCFRKRRANFSRYRNEM